MGQPLSPASHATTGAAEERHRGVMREHQRLTKPKTPNSPGLESFPMFVGTGLDIVHITRSGPLGSFAWKKGGGPLPGSHIDLGNNGILTTTRSCGSVAFDDVESRLKVGNAPLHARTDR